MWDLSSTTRDQTHAPCLGSTVLTIGPSGKFHGFFSDYKNNTYAFILENLKGRSKDNPYP